MLLLFEVLGVLAGAALLAAIVGRGVGRRSFALGAAIIPAAVACAVLGTGLWPTTRNVLAERASQAALSPQEAQSAPGRSADVEIDFVEWAREQIPAGETFLVVGEDRGQQWTTFRLLPNLAVDRPEDADWIVFYGEDPEDADAYDPSAFGEPEEFDDGFAVARRSG